MPALLGRTRRFARIRRCQYEQARYPFWPILPHYPNHSYIPIAVPLRRITSLCRPVQRSPGVATTSRSAAPADIGNPQLRSSLRHPRAPPAHTCAPAETWPTEACFFWFWSAANEAGQARVVWENHRGMLPHPWQIRNCKDRRSTKKNFLRTASLKQIIRIVIG